jgi:hypothetical protein
MKKFILLTLCVFSQLLPSAEEAMLAALQHSWKQHSGQQ